MSNNSPRATITIEPRPTNANLTQCALASQAHVAVYKKSTTTNETTLLPPISSIVSQSEFAQQTLHNARVFMLQSVQDTSRASYMTGWNHWKRWAPMFGTDLLMRTIPAHFLEDRENTFSLSECCVLSFLAHLRNNVGVSGNVACGYLSGVRFMLLNSGVDIRFLDNSPCIKATRAGLHLLHRAENPECDKKALPVACEMILYAKNTLFNSNSIESMAICIAMQVGFCNLARVSEYIRTKATEPKLK